jgi:SAM-dependent methyltransferase
MKLHHGPVASKFSETLKPGTYDDVASEYYDEQLHPTCADFRDASTAFLRDFFRSETPKGRIAEIGCGISLLSELAPDDLVLVDSSAKMLSKNQNVAEKRLLNVETSSFGEREFDWVFAILADPYNSKAAWQNIARALKHGARALFVVPSHYWASHFRSAAGGERDGFARFDRADTSSVFLASAIYPREEQVSLIRSAGLAVLECEHVPVRAINRIRSRKISEFLSDDDPILDGYYVHKP